MSAQAFLSPSMPQQATSSYFAAEREEMLPFVPKGAERFLEIGCGAGAFGALLRRTIPNAHIVGVEVYGPAAEEARKVLDDIVELPVETAIERLPQKSFDCVICNDVLEHLVDPWLVLRRVRGLLRTGGSVIASLPNVRHFPVFRSYFLEADWRYEQWGVLDQTHLRFFTARSLSRMFEETGYLVEKVEGIFPEKFSWKAALLNIAMRGRLDDMRYQRFAVVARS